MTAKFNGVVPPSSRPNQTDSDMIAQVNELLKSYTQNMEAVKLRAALKAVMDISARGNVYLQDNKLDNTLFEKERERCETVMANAVNLIYLLAVLMEPFMPGASRDTYRQLNAPPRRIPDEFTLDLLPGHRIGKPEHLFKRIEEQKVNELFLKYGGEKILERKKKEAEAKAAEAKAKKAAAKPVAA